jgi:pseudaminic acid biosynthesis-associated methylase
MPDDAEARRLESLWSGSFGDAYIVRNRDAGRVRRAFWDPLLAEFPVRRALEVGCNIGANLEWIAGLLPPGGAVGLDVNDQALQHVRRSLPAARPLKAAARRLPFHDGSFDLVFSVTVLIHQPESTLPLVMDEIVRCSSRFVLCGEYHAPQTIEVPYRGQTGALFKRDYGRLYQDRHPGLRLRKSGFLGQRDGWDDVTWWMFEKQTGSPSSNGRRVMP